MKCAASVILASITSLLFMACSGDAEKPSPPIETAVCLQGTPFVADGVVPLDARAPGTAYEVSALRWESYEGCGRFVIDFSAEDGIPAASVGDVKAEVMRELGVVRIELPDVVQVRPEATDAAFDGLARAAYSVWSNKGRWVYVDLHLADEAEAHIAVLKDPGRVVIDLRPGGPVLPPPAARDRHVVVLSPRAGEQNYPLTVTGYARTFEANVVARIARDAEDVDETFTTATAWVDAWGHYALTFDEGPSGPISLHVGAYSARDGSWEGVSVELDMQQVNTAIP